MKRAINVFAEPELVDLLAQESELLAIADAIAATQAPSRAPTSRRLGVRRSALLAASLLAATAILATPVGGAIARVGGDVVDQLSSWVDGSPGESASEEAGEEFARQNEASLVRFPETTDLRHLTSAEAHGYRFELLGFRSGGSLCLRLVVTGKRDLVPASCVLLRDLEAGSPVTVVTRDAPFGAIEGERSENIEFLGAASATFGFAQDGVRAIEVIGPEGPREVGVSSNVFLHLAERPRSGSSINSVVAIKTDGTRVPIPLAQTLPLQPVSDDESSEAPNTIERVVSGPIRWLDRREERGDPLPPDLAGELFRLGAEGGLLFGRVLQPDPDSTAAIAVALIEAGDASSNNGRFEPAVCVAELRAIRGGGGGCGLKDFDGAFGIGGVSEAFAHDQFLSWFGLVADEVAEVKVYPAQGVPFRVPLADNAFVVDLHKTALPAMVAAFDADGRVVGLLPGPRLD